MADKILTPEELFALRDAEVQQGQALIDQAEAEGREFTEDEAEALTKHRAAAQDFQERGDRGVTAREEREALTGIRETALAVPDPQSRPTSSVRVRESMLDDPKRGWRHLGEQAAAIYRHASGAGTDKRLLIGAAATGMEQAVGAEGGFAVAPAFSTTIWDGMNSDPDNLLGRTDAYPVTGESLEFAANAETSRATGSRWGGVRGYWLAEAAQITSSAPKLRKMKLEPQELGVLVYATKKLLGNAPALERYLTEASREEITFLTGDAIVNGDGVGKPKGLLNSSCVVSVAKESSQAAATILTANLSKMWARLHPRSRRNAVWLANVDCEPELDNLFLQVTNVAGAENVGGLNPRLVSYSADGSAMNIKGRPVLFTEYNATLGTVGDLILADLGMYATGTSGGVDEAMSIHLRFDYAETAFRFMFAVDGQTWLNSAITPFKGTNTLTTVVTLATRA